MSVASGGQIVKSGLTMNLDAGDIASYSESRSTWFDISENNYNAALANNFIYVSGVSITSAPSSATIAQNTAFSGYYGPLPARVSAFRTYIGKGLTQPEVSQNYRIHRARFEV